MGYVKTTEKIIFANCFGFPFNCMYSVYKCQLNQHQKCFPEHLARLLVNCCVLITTEDLFDVQSVKFNLHTVQKCHIAHWTFLCGGVVARTCKSFSLEKKTVNGGFFLFVACCCIFFVTIIRRDLKCAIPAFYKTNLTA